MNALKIKLYDKRPVDYFHSYEIFLSFITITFENHNGMVMINFISKRIYANNFTIMVTTTMSYITIQNTKCLDKKK